VGQLYVFLLLVSGGEVGPVRVPRPGEVRADAQQIGARDHEKCDQVADTQSANRDPHRRSVKCDGLLGLAGIDVEHQFAVLADRPPPLFFDKARIFSIRG
jgi:hypothetical protein